MSNLLNQRSKLKRQLKPLVHPRRLSFTMRNRTWQLIQSWSTITIHLRCYLTSARMAQRLCFRPSPQPSRQSFKLWLRISADTCKRTNSTRSCNQVMHTHSCKALFPLRKAKSHKPCEVVRPSSTLMNAPARLTTEEISTTSCTWVRRRHRGSSGRMTP